MNSDQAIALLNKSSVNMKNFHCVKIIIMAAFIIYSVTANAQNNIGMVRYDDNFSALKSDSIKRGLDKLKNIKLSGNSSVSFGGEIREQFQIYKNINFGDLPPKFTKTNTEQINHRLMIHANIESGHSLRFFLQLNNTLRFLNANPGTPEIDENHLSLHQAFSEFKLKKWKFRIGRQELFYGNHRLITVREGPNTRQTFDGLVTKREVKNGAIDFFIISKVLSKKYIFDDKSFNETLIGIYGTQHFSDHKIGLDYYALDFRSKYRKYNSVSGKENRQTYGARLFTNFNLINFEIEGAYQSGKFGDLKIDAYSALADLNLTLLPGKKMKIGIAANIASGDKDERDNKLNTYNLIYAKPAFGMAIPLGNSNLISVSPYIKINAVPKFTILTQVFLLSKFSDRDGMYSPAMFGIRPGSKSSDNKATNSLGEFFVLETTYQQTQNISFAIDLSYFNAGSSLKSTGRGKDLSYLSFKSAFKF